MSSSTQDTLHSTAPGLQPKTINSALLGGISLTVISGIHGYLVEPHVISVFIWGLGGLVLGLSIGMLAQLPTDAQNSWVRLGQAAIQGFARGILVGLVFQTIISLGSLLRMQDGEPPDLALLYKAVQGISSFAFCGTILSILTVIPTILTRFRGDQAQVLTIIKFAIGGMAVNVLHFSWLVLTEFPFNFIILAIFAFTGMAIGAIIGFIPAANQ